ncbi:hypothetical protein BGZ57DRAFT_528681 [Hyaloscypha finlandica]|nr:hypothetical protein BGZ57DRAFT_528681 [Hyaloscypha finlandica]KAH8789086.1 hypothetical protein F5882DRAFT_402717 [Hyaloscypha sp. PMI_1271]
MTSSNNDLSSLLTPELFRRVFKNRLPWPIEKPLDFKEVFTYVFRSDGGSHEEELRKIAWPTLKALSTLGVDNVPDMMQFLPPPESRDFPEQALGVQLLLDQGPRALFEGMDARYIYDYFQYVARKYAQQLLDLPSALRIDSKKRWMEELGASFDFWVMARLWLIAPVVHSEVLVDHELALSMGEDVRVEVEKFTGETDPYRAKRAELAEDIYAFGRMYLEGPPLENGVKMHQWFFWMWAVLDVHKPIIDKFGKYPYQDVAKGRESTDEEKEWTIVFQNGVDKSNSKVAQRIREDVVKGRWTPLGQEDEK